VQAAAYTRVVIVVIKPTKPVEKEGIMACMRFPALCCPVRAAGFTGTEERSRFIIFYRTALQDTEDNHG
jgi:hypothetical protein